MEKIQKDQITPLSTVLPYFILSGVSLLVVCLMIVLSANSFQSHYFQPKLLCITHIATLGFVTSIIFGSLYLILPVVLQVSVYSKKFANLTFYFLLSGIIILCYSFWQFSTGVLMHLGGCLVFLSFVLFSINYYLSVRKCKDWMIEADLISTSLIWLLVTGGVGVLLAFNFSYPFISVSHLQILKFHAHIGFLGWIFLLIAGVASKLIPMFLVVQPDSKAPLSIVYYFINGGLLLLGAVLYFELSNYLLYFVIVIISIGVFSFLFFMFSILRKRIRGKLDTGLRLSMISFLFLLVAVVVGFIIPSTLLEEKEMILLQMSYAIAGFLGFTGTLILGQGMKIVPFVIWIHRYSKMAGNKKIPLPKDLISERLSLFIMILFLSGLIILLFSIPMQQFGWIKAGGSFLILAAVCHNINLFKAIIHKVKY